MTNPFNVKKPASVTSLKNDVTKASENFSQERLVGMTFNMPRDWHTEFKISAATRGMSMRDLMIECFEVWKQKT